MIKEAIKELTEGKDLSPKMASESFDEIMSGTATQAQIASFLTALAIKGETDSEIAEFAKIMRQKSKKVPKDEAVLEIVGTGGDQVGTFNISTASAIICAAAGVPVAKHGNRSVSSKCGAADVLDELGIKIDLDKDENAKVLDETGICFMFAPVYHQSMKYAAPVRVEMAIPTVFNILGPLANPALAEIQLLGVYDKELIPVMAEVLKNVGLDRFMVVNGRDGLDEITLTDQTDMMYFDGNELKEMVIDPKDYGFEYCQLEDLIGGDQVENAQIIRDILDGKEKGPKRDVVLLNSGAALYLAGKVDSVKDGIKLAEDMIDSGKATKKLEQFISVSNRDDLR